MRLSLLLVSLLFLTSGSAAAQTPEIEELQKFHQEAQALSGSPISNEEREQKLQGLYFVTTSAEISSRMIVRSSTGGAERDLESSLETIDQNLDQGLLLAEQSYLTTVQQAESEAVRSARRAEEVNRSAVARINKEAKEKLSRCTTSSCRKEVESKRRKSLDTANARLRADLRAIQNRKQSSLAEAVKSKETQVSNLEAQHSKSSLDARELYRMRQEAILTAHANRMTLIGQLQTEAESFILARPSLQSA